MLIWAREEVLNIKELKTPVTGNSSDLGVCLSSMPVNWIGQVAIRVLSRRSRGDFQPIDAKSTSCSTSSPWPPSPGQEKGDLCCGGHPHIPRQGLRPCNPFLVFPDQKSSPVVDPHWCDIMPLRSRHP